MTVSNYQKPEIPADEEERLSELNRLNILDTAAEVRFDRYTSMVADIFDFPVVLVSLVSHDRQWFKSSIGLDLKECPRDISLCGHAIVQQGVMVIPDTLKDKRFANNPLVTGEPYIRFYAGAVVHSPKGQPLGTLCLIDHEPREFNEQQCKRLRQFAELIESEIKHNSDLEELRASVEFSAFYDPLTQLPNRRLLTDRLEKLLELSEFEKRQVAVLLFNVAGLRLFNQSLGTEAGDELLRQLADRLQGCCPAGGTVARLQADEFVLVFPSLNSNKNHIDKVAEQARAALVKSFRLMSKEHYIRVQIGASVFPDNGVTSAGLLEQASAAIRFAGQGEPGAICYFNKAESESISENLKIESSLRGALENNEFSLLYQPIVNLEDAKLAGVEALLRWHNKELGSVPPDKFIPIAERNGLIVAIGRWVQQEVCRQIKCWSTQNSWALPVAINVAAAELLQPEFSTNLIQRMEADGIAPELLWVEVTEFSLASDSPTVDENLALLSKAQIRVHIDDFGTGYSSLSYLQRMPISSLKIDRSFINGLPHNNQELALTRSILSMSSDLGLATVAEGIENRQQYDFLRDSGCKMGQGFLLARPLQASEIEGLRDRSLI
ncbi:GGDEF domain-containing protein [Lacimicrobium alkaliphilum]|uniref:Diguanylate cyclase n=1 Tax=Lacimicrobium alkaliphilum TaxID=1526571 RepID=A0A0U3B404_9ALTE|nr:GGDEF domain-containing protein [Lacimicrobium alkaliphilum]ALS98265.1 hypothetical protein AT746_08385 [Lacimicrobium alkaliphilum]